MFCTCELLTAIKPIFFKVYSLIGGLFSQQLLKVYELFIVSAGMPMGMGGGQGMPMAQGMGMGMPMGQGMGMPMGQGMQGMGMPMQGMQGMGMPMGQGMGMPMGMVRSSFTFLSYFGKFLS